MIYDIIYIYIHTYITIINGHGSCVVSYPLPPLGTPPPGLPVDAAASGVTPLSEAAAAGKTAVLQLLLERKVRWNGAVRGHGGDDQVGYI